MQIKDKFPTISLNGHYGQIVPLCQIMNTS